MSASYDLQHLRWRCRRGMKELDQLMLRYLQLYFNDAADDEKQAFCRLLDCEEPHLLALLSGSIQSDDISIAAVIGKIQNSPAVNYS